MDILSSNVDWKANRGALNQAAKQLANHSIETKIRFLHNILRCMVHGSYSENYPFNWLVGKYKNRIYNEARGGPPTHAARDLAKLLRKYESLAGEFNNNFTELAYEFEEDFPTIVNKMHHQLNWL